MSTSNKSQVSETRPDAVEDEHLEYLDNLRESGAVNMFGAREYLQNEYPELSKADARAILLYWMNSFDERHKCGK